MAFFWNRHPYGQYFIHHQYIRAPDGCHRKGQTHTHPTTVTFWGYHGVASRNQAKSIDDFSSCPLSRPCSSQDGPIQINVLLPCQFRMKNRSNFNKEAILPGSLMLPLVGLVTRESILSNVDFPAPFFSDNPQHFSFLYLKIDIHLAPKHNPPWPSRYGRSHYQFLNRVFLSANTMPKPIKVIAQSACTTTPKRYCLLICSAFKITPIILYR